MFLWSLQAHQGSSIEAGRYTLLLLIKTELTELPKFWGYLMDLYL